jgi:hypothetical protein
MKTAYWSWAAMVVALGIATTGCASDDVKLPEAELGTPGAFIAVDGYDVDDEIRLIRTIDRLNFEVETLLFFSTYDVKPKNWDEARELAQQPNLPLRIEIEAQTTNAITEHAWQVVWFRTLTDDEQGRVQ